MTVNQMRSALMDPKVGYNGPSDDASIVAAYNRTAVDPTKKSALATTSSNASLLADLMATSNAQDFAEKVREFNLTLQEQQREFDQNHSLQQDTVYKDLATSLLNGASQLSGPSNYYAFNQYTSGGRDLVAQLFGGQARPGFSAPTGAIKPMSMDQLMADLGVPQTALPATPTANGTNAAVPPDLIAQAAASLKLPVGIIQDYANQWHSLPVDTNAFNTWMTTNGYRNPDGSLTGKGGAATSANPTAQISAAAAPALATGQMAVQSTGPAPNAPATMQSSPPITPTAQTAAAQPATPTTALPTSTPAGTTGPADSQSVTQLLFGGVGAPLGTAYGNTTAFNPTGQWLLDQIAQQNKTGTGGTTGAYGRLQAAGFDKYMPDPALRQLATQIDGLYSQGQMTAGNLDKLLTSYSGNWPQQGTDAVTPPNGQQLRALFGQQNATSNYLQDSGAYGRLVAGGLDRYLPEATLREMAGKIDTLYGQGQMTPENLDSVLGGYQRYLDPAAFLKNTLATTPPAQINPIAWNNAGSVGQALTLSAVKAAGWDPNEWLSQLKASMPVGTAPKSTTMNYGAGNAAPAGVY